MTSIAKTMGGTTGRRLGLHITVLICVILWLLNLYGGMVMTVSFENHLRTTTALLLLPPESPCDRDADGMSRSNAWRTIDEPLNRFGTADSDRQVLSKHKSVSDSVPMSHTQPQLSKNETIIVGLANHAYMEVAILWYHRMTDAGFSTHRILAADKATVQKCKELQFRYDDLSKFITKLNPGCVSFGANLFGWERKTFLFAARWIYVREKLMEGYHVLLTDVDAVYNYRAPLSLLQSNNEYDHYTAYADKMPMDVFRQLGFTICGCFHWMRSTPSMIHFLNLFLSNCGCIITPSPTKVDPSNSCHCHCDDQVTMNSMLLYQLDMKWDNSIKNGEDDHEAFRQHRITGVSQRTGQRMKVMDRNFVFRGHHTNKCTKGNWITFPKTNNETETKVEQMQRLLGNCPLQMATKNQVMPSPLITNASLIL